MNLDAWLAKLQETEVATAIRESGSLFPWVEAFHVLAVTIVVGTIGMLDLRLLGWAFGDRSIERVMRDVMPSTWGGFAVSVLSGLLLFSSNAVTYAHNRFFQTKMVELALLGINALVFGLWTSLGNGARDDDGRPALRARTTGGLSLALWIGVVICGRWIGFTRLSSR